MPPPDGYTNVADSFKMVNMWGFYNFVSLLGSGLLLCCLFCCCRLVFGMSKHEIRDYVFPCGGLLFIGFLLSYFANLVTIAVERFGHSGRVCSGDYDSELSIFTLEQQKPYLHLSGSWFFYYLATLNYSIAVIISGSSFIAGKRR